MMSNVLTGVRPLDYYDPSVIVTGVSFRTLDVVGRELLARKVPHPEELAQRIVSDGLAKEAAVISTCNRFEILSVGGEGGGIRAFFSSLLELERAPTDVLYQYLDASAVKHLYRVSASLDSMVLGEVQILGQVKQAYKRAVQVGSVGSHLHHLFQSAFHVAKRVRAHTEISSHGVSVSYIAVRLAQQIFADLSACSVVLVGSGEMAELAALHLCSHGCRKIVVANRTVERAAELAERFGGAAVALGDLEQVLDRADIVISSISIDHPIVTLASLARRSNEKPLFLIDLGMPRNVSPDLAQVDSVYLYNIDDLAAIAGENRSLREAAARDAEIVIEYGLLQFERWRAKVRAQPAIVDLRSHVAAICEGEVQRVLGHLAQQHPDVAIDLSQAICKKLSHTLGELIHGRSAADEELGRPFVVPPHDRSSET
jgi:glutamyl-tRNA reductase